MSIKSDKWIRRMAQQHGLIDPFEAGQVRTAEGGRRLISYGTSSYGYDVRCAPEFKIFTNINSTIVDPKQFDEKSFVDVTADVCIIPPNSFALARTVEYFRIPRSVLTVCLGKCVTGDTRVVDADTGAYLPITEMRWGKSTLGLDNWRLKKARVSDFIPQGKKAIFELRTRAGLRIRATANHPFRMLNGWVALGDLRPGDRIAAARDIPLFGKTAIPDWEATLLGLMISEGQCNTPGHGPASATADPALVRKYGLNVGAADKFVPQAVFTAPEHSVRVFLQALFAADAGLYASGAEAFLEYHSKSRRLVEDVHHLLLRFGIFSSIREHTTGIGTRACRIQITEQHQIRRFAERIGFSPGCLQQQRLETQISLMSLSSLGVHTSGQSVASGAAKRIAFRTGDLCLDPLIEGPLWDVVEKIEPAGTAEVFDICVPNLHNFVANDLIVHNSTYARCFRGDTRVALVNGESPTLEDMARRHDSGELFWGYSLGQSGRIVMALLDLPRFIGRDALVEVTLDNDEIIRATPDHMFVRRDGLLTAAHDLRPGDSLMPLYRSRRRGYEQVYQPINGYLLPTGWLAAEWNLRNSVNRDLPGAHVLRHCASMRQANHKITAIRELPGDHDVYCLTVPEAGNFALEAGVFVENCGIIVNVTPLEPEWEGHVTLEFSNTTPLPAKIYANEGVAQMLFFESDEVCETSYADRGGKYQKQRGVTLPKA
jgi:deoxycytidine triphosphate deaminase